jgi:hypothetical protein
VLRKLYKNLYQQWKPKIIYQHTTDKREHYYTPGCARFGSLVTAGDGAIAANLSQEKIGMSFIENRIRGVSIYRTKR